MSLKITLKTIDVGYQGGLNAKANEAGQMGGLFAVLLEPDTNVKEALEVRLWPANKSKLILLPF